MTTPMNISMNRLDNYCDEKCAYSFNYQISNICNATNYGSYLYLNYFDSGTVSPVTFNANTYKVENIEIYSPSLHYFNNQTIDGEVIITHIPTSIGKPLIVCIPISVTGRQATTATQIIEDIINAAVGKPLKQGDPTMTIKLNNYSLNSIVPVTPFFFYTDTNDYNIVVYGLSNAISVNQSVIAGLQTIITGVSDIKYPSVQYLEYNKTGPSMGLNGESQIYIDCQPTGNSEETEQVTYSKNATNNDMGSVLNSPVVIFIVAALIFVFLIIMIHNFLVYLTSGAASTSLSSPFGKSKS
jgi:hypothetical protein